MDSNAGWNASLVRDGHPSPVTAEHASHVVDIIESGYRAAATGRTQDLRTTFPFPPRGDA